MTSTYTARHVTTRRRTIRALVAGVALSALAAAGIALTQQSDAASLPSPEAGNVVALGAAPRIVGAPGTLLGTKQTTSIAVAGKTFGAVTVPADATAVTVAITSIAPTADGALKIWTPEAGEPGTGAVQFLRGKQATNNATVALNGGKLNVTATVRTRFVMALLNYVTPVAPITEPAAPVVRQADAVARKTINVGGSVRIRASEFGSITLPAGTWNMSVRGTFVGFNNGTDLPTGVNVTGTMLVQRGDAMGDDFENNTTVGGIAIPRAQSDTLTQDPTAAINDVLVLATETTLHFKAFGYASDSSTRDGVLKFGLDSATFVKIG